MNFRESDTMAWITVHSDYEYLEFTHRVNEQFQTYYSIQQNFEASEWDFLDED